MSDPATDYADAMKILREGDVAARVALACDPATPPEVLYYLTDDPAAEVRRAVAENPLTPAQADVKLSRDSDIPVRCALARKVVGDGLPQDERRELWRMGFTVLETLMRDQVVKVRHVLTEAFCTPPDAPRKIVVGLARDPEEAVAAPVLEASPVLTDDDMIEILDGGAPEWAQTAMAGRETVSPKLGQSLVTSGATPAVARAVANYGAQFTEPTLDILVERSQSMPELQESLVNRPNLAGSLIVKLAKFVAEPLLGVLCKRPDMDADTATQVNGVIEKRPDKPKIRARPAKQSVARSWRSGGKRPKTEPRLAVEQSDDPASRARQMHEAGTLSDEAIALALDNKEHDFVLAALSLRSRLPLSAVRRMIKVESGRTVVALAWKAGLTARFAMDLQRHLARIPFRKIVNARNGVDFPMSSSEMEEQLSFFV